MSPYRGSFTQWAVVLWVVIAAPALCFFTGVAALADEAKTVAVTAGVVNLFNGKNLDGFYTFLKDRGRDNDPAQVFTVQDGVLRISGEEWGCITSIEEYADYRLVTEFKWGEKTHAPRADNARDSGILLHSIGPDGAYGGIWMYSIEGQLIEGGTGDFIVVGDGSPNFAVTCTVAPEKSGDCHVYQPFGAPVTVHKGRINWVSRDKNWSDTKGFRGPQDAEKPTGSAGILAGCAAGEWNRLELIADGSTITIILNGIVVNQATDVKPNKGRIQVQSEGAEIFFRRIDLLPLEPKLPTPSRTSLQRRFIYNDDGSNMFIDVPPPMTPAGVYACVDKVAGTGVTTFFMCPNFGMVMCYPSQVTEMIGSKAAPEALARIQEAAAAQKGSTERGIANLRALVDAGHDPIKLVIDRAHEKKMEAFITFRLNEIHDVEHPDSLIVSQFWRDHPEWRVGKLGDPLRDIFKQILGPRVHPIVGTWFPGALNFAVPEVRALRLAEIRECCERYPIDGIDLDFQRFPIFFPQDQGRQNVETMTAWLREVRAMTREVSAKRGRPLLVSARVLARPEQNLEIGLDPAAWAKEGLIDFIIVSHYLRNDFPLPVAAYRRVLPPDMPLYASIEVEPRSDTFRRIARRLWDDGVDGISLFNFIYNKEPPFELLKELGDPATIKATEDTVAMTAP